MICAARPPRLCFGRGLALLVTVHLTALSVAAAYTLQLPWAAEELHGWGSRSPENVGGGAISHVDAMTKPRSLQATAETAWSSVASHAGDDAQQPSTVVTAPLRPGSACVDSPLLREVRPLKPTPPHCQLSHDQHGLCPHQDFGLELIMPSDDCGGAKVEFNAAAFIKMMSGRTLWLVGDSVTQQFVTMLSSCLLAEFHKQPRGNRRRRYDRRRQLLSRELLQRLNRDEKPADAQGVHAIKGDTCPVKCRHFAAAQDSMQVCYVPVAMHVVPHHSAPCWKKMKRTDVALVNVGLWHNAPQTLQKSVQHFAKFVRGTAKAAYKGKAHVHLPTIIWRESAPQHFPNGPGGNFNIMLKSGDELCKDYSLQEMVVNDWRNQNSLPIIQAAGIEVLKVWNLTATMAKLHPNVPSGHSVDCTHFCQHPGGLMEAWAALLQSRLSNILTRSTAR